jgi:hypothetical protein
MQNLYQPTKPRQLTTDSQRLSAMLQLAAANGYTHIGKVTTGRECTATIYQLQPDQSLVCATVLTYDEYGRRTTRIYPYRSTRTQLPTSARPLEAH